MRTSENEIEDTTFVSHFSYFLILAFRTNSNITSTIIYIDLEDPTCQ